MPTDSSQGAASAGGQAGKPARGGRAAVTWAGIVVAGTVGAAIGVAGFTFHYAEGMSYLSDDPSACVNCHVMQEHYDGWQHASHHRVASCNDCHVPHDSVLHKYLVKAEHGYRHSKGFTFNDFHEPIQITPGSRAVVVDNCIRCHTSIGDDLIVRGTPAPSPPRDIHAGASADCLHCHARVGHGPTR